MATVTKGRTFTSGETVTPAKLNDVVDMATVTFSTASDTDDSTLEVSGNKFRVKDGGVTNANLVTAVQQALIPAGAVQAFAMNSAPAGWLAADGTEYAKTGTYAALFAAISTTYGETNGSGGAGTSHFRVPDLRGYFVRGSGTNSDGTSAGTFATRQADDLKSHTHGAALTYLYGRTGVTTNSIAVGGDNADYGRNFLAATGGTETRPKNIAMLYCIKF